MSVSTEKRLQQLVDRSDELSLALHKIRAIARAGIRLDLDDDIDALLLVIAELSEDACRGRVAGGKS